MTRPRSFQPHDPSDWDAHNPLGPSSQALVQGAVPSARPPAMQQLLMEVLRAIEENQDAIQSWTAPLEGPSRAIGAAIAGRNPFQGGRIEGPAVSEALTDRGVHPLLAAGAEFLVPDPTGAKKATDLLPLLGVLPFLRSVRSDPELQARLLGRVAAPGGSRGLMEDLETVGARRLDPVTDVGVELRTGELRPDGEFVRVQLLHQDDGTMRADNLLSTFAEGGRGELRTLLPVLDAADANGVTLVAEPSPFAHQRSDLNGLYRQYAKAGFEVDADRPTQMVRRPLPLDDAERQAEAARRLQVTQEYLASPSGFGDPAMESTVDRLLRQELGISLEDWLEGVERMGPAWGREMLEQTSLADLHADSLMSSYQLGVRPGGAVTPSGAYQVNLPSLYRRVEGATTLTRDDLVTIFTGEHGLDSAAAEGILARLGVTDPEAQLALLADVGFTPHEPLAGGTLAPLFSSENFGVGSPPPAVTPLGRSHGYPQELASAYERYAQAGGDGRVLQERVNANLLTREEFARELADARRAGLQLSDVEEWALTNDLFGAPGVSAPEGLGGAGLVAFYDDILSEVEAGLNVTREQLLSLVGNPEFHEHFVQAFAEAGYPRSTVDAVLQQLRGAP